MKKALIISSIIFVVSIIAFGISVAATGLREGNFTVAIGLDKVFDKDFETDTDLGERTTKHFEFIRAAKDIEINISSADTLIEIADVDKIIVEYTGDNRRSIKANLDGDKLVVEEDINFVVTFINWSFGDDEAELKITLPRKEYDDVKLNAASGKIDINGLICNDFDANSASGNMNYRIFANDIKISTLSGCVELTNCTDRRAKSLNMTSTSGDHSVSGFMTDKFALESMSGSISADGISGEGDIDITSGEIDLVYAQWDNELDIDAVSGSVDVTLPADSGVIVELSATSGGVDVDLTGETSGSATARLSGDSKSGVIGGSNVHAVEVDLISGDVDIHN